MGNEISSSPLPNNNDPSQNEAQSNNSLIPARQTSSPSHICSPKTPADKTSYSSEDEQVILTLNSTIDPSNDNERPLSSSPTPLATLIAPAISGDIADSNDDGNFNGREYENQEKGFGASAESLKKLACMPRDPEDDHGFSSTFRTTETIITPQLLTWSRVGEETSARKTNSNEDSNLNTVDSLQETSTRQEHPNPPNSPIICSADVSRRVVLETISVSSTGNVTRLTRTPDYSHDVPPDNLQGLLGEHVLERLKAGANCHPAIVKAGTVARSQLAEAGSVANSDDGHDTKDDEAAEDVLLDPIQHSEDSISTYEANPFLSDTHITSANQNIEVSQEENSIEEVPDLIDDSEDTILTHESSPSPTVRHLTSTDQTRLTTKDHDSDDEPRDHLNDYFGPIPGPADVPELSENAVGLGPRIRELLHVPGNIMSLAPWNRPLLGSSSDSPPDSTAPGTWRPKTKRPKSKRIRKWRSGNMTERRKGRSVVMQLWRSKSGRRAVQRNARNALR